MLQQPLELVKIYEKRMNSENESTGSLDNLDKQCTTKFIVDNLSESITMTVYPLVDQKRSESLVEPGV